MNRKPIVMLVLCGLLVGCDYIAIQAAPAKKASATRSDAAKRADESFWKILHGGKYDKIPDVLTALTAAYLQNPSDATTAAHIGFLHIWALSERARLDKVPPTITDHAVVARKYFTESYRLNPDPRILGFIGSITLAEGRIHQDEKLVREGYFTLKDSIRAWPEFNYFTAGYSMSRVPADTDKYREAMEWQWQNVDICAGEKIDRNNPDFAKYMKRVTDKGEKRVCWNNWIAPHNFEGFFLNLGDMLVKGGDWQTGQKAYANAKLAPSYSKWKYRDMLEDRMTHARENVALFSAPVKSGTPFGKAIMVDSGFGCMACHQE